MQEPIETRLKIGEFAKVGRTSITTLRYYDEVGLLRPCVIDESTKYRYYELCQLPRLNRILALKDLGLSIEQITQFLHESAPPSLLREVLNVKRMELREHISESQQRLIRVEARLQQIEREGRISKYDIVEKSIAPMRVISTRGAVPTYREVDQLFEKLRSAIGPSADRISGPGIAIWYDEEYQESDPDGEAAFPWNGSAPENPFVEDKVLPSVDLALSVLHAGPPQLLTEAYAAIFGWANAQGYHSDGPLREVYLNVESGIDAARCLTEVQLPVCKAPFTTQI